MRMKSLVNAVIVLSALAATVVASDTVILKNGSRITADILKSDEKAVIVDLGCEIIRLPRSEVTGEIKGDQAATQPTATTQPAIERKSPQWQLFRTAKLKSMSIESGAKRNGQAVVMVKTPSGLGSGFIISPEGHLITNYHVVANETRIKVTVYRRSKNRFEPKHYKKVKIVALNPFSDLALLKIQEASKPFKYVHLGQMDRVKVGEQVYAIGNPLGLTRTVSQGIVSTKNRNFQGQLYIQTTTDVNPGNSGGPLFNLKGEVIGVTSMGYIYLSGLNFAIPVDVVKRFIENRDAFAYDEDNPNAGVRYLQPAPRIDKTAPPAGKVPTIETGADETPSH